MLMVLSNFCFRIYTIYTHLYTFNPLFSWFDILLHSFISVWMDTDKGKDSDSVSSCSCVEGRKASASSLWALAAPTSFLYPCTLRYKKFVGTLNIIPSIYDDVFESNSKKGLGWDWYQASEQASQIPAHWTGKEKKNVFMDLALCTCGIVMLKQERAFPKLLPRSWRHTIVQMKISLQILQQ